MNINRHQGIINKIERYLEIFALPPKPQRQEIKRIAQESFIEAYKIGVNSQGSFNRWAWLHLISKGQFVKDKNAQNYIRDKRHGSIDQGLENYIADGYKISRAVIKRV